MTDTSGERTPRLTQEPTSIISRPGSPSKSRRGSALGPGMHNGSGVSGLGEHRKGSVPRTLSTHDTLSGGLGLGLGIPDARKAFHRQDDALASPRRISTSRALGGGGNGNAGSYPSAPGSFLSPTNETYYSQPPSASTPRFRQASLAPGPSGYGSTNLGSSYSHSTTLSPGTHRRNFSVHSTMSNSPLIQPQSPVGSVFRKIRKTASAVGLSLGTPGSYDGQEEDEGYDAEGEVEEEDEARKSNGTRVWYR